MTDEHNDNIIMSRLGFYLDGWADLIESMGHSVHEIRKDVYSELKRRNMPEVEVNEVEAQAAPLKQENRPYSIITRSPGATSAVYISKHGDDLYASWKVFLRYVLNKKLLLDMLKLAGGIGGVYWILNILRGFGIGLYEGFLTSSAAMAFGKGLVFIFLWGLATFLGLFIITYLFELASNTLLYPVLYKASSPKLWLFASIMTFSGRFLYDWRLLVKNNIKFDMGVIWYPIICGVLVFVVGVAFIWASRLLMFVSEEMRSWEQYIPALAWIAAFVGMSTANRNAMWGNLTSMVSIFWSYLRFGLSSLTFAIVISLYVIGGCLVLMILGGLFIHKNAIYFFLVHPTYFDADDISAMTLIVHKSLLRVLDNHGVDTDKLRIKEKFTGGRKGEHV